MSILVKKKKLNSYPEEHSTKPNIYNLSFYHQPRRFWTASK